MEHNDLIKDFTDKIINNDETSNESIKQVIVNKTKDLVKTWKAQKVFEDVFSGSAIKFNGDDVLVNNKRVGRLSYDLNDMEGGINFVSEDGRFSKEFEKLQDLYSYLMQTYNVKENKMEDLGTKIDDPKKIEFANKGGIKQDGTTTKLGTKIDDPKDFEFANKGGLKQDATTTKLGTKIDDPAALNAGKSGTPQDTDGDKKSQTKGKFDPDGETAVGPLGKYSKLKTLIADIKAGKRKTDTSETVSENKKNWNMDNAEAGGPGKEGALKAKVKKIKEIADKQGVKKDE